MTWLYYSLGTAIGYTCLNLLSRTVSVKSKNPRALSIAFNIVSIFLAIILFLITGSYKNFSLPIEREAWIYFLIAAFFYGTYEKLRFYASKYLDASVYSIIGNITIVMAFIFSLFLYKEVLTLSKSIGFILILLAIFLVSEKKKSKILAKGLFYGIATSVCIGIAMSLDKKGATFFSPNVYNLLAWMGPFIVLWFPGIRITEIKQQFQKFSWKIVLLSFFNFIAYFFGLKAFVLAEATQVIPIMQLSTIMTVIAGIFLLNEKSNLLKKIIAGVIAVAGVFLLR